MGRRGQPHPVIQFSVTDQFITRFPSAYQAGKILGLNGRRISECCLGNAKTAFGYKWKFETYPDLPGEEWMKHPHYPILCSTKGRVKPPNGVPKFGTHKNLYGYWTYGFRVDSKSKTFMVSRLIAETFHQERNEDRIQVDHINRKRDDNRSINLRWVTPGENSRNKKRT
jgi:hypothetical protein